MDNAELILKLDELLDAVDDLSAVVMNVVDGDTLEQSKLRERKMDNEKITEQLIVLGEAIDEMSGLIRKFEKITRNIMSGLTASNPEETEKEESPEYPQDTPWIPPEETEKEHGIQGTTLDELRRAVQNFLKNYGKEKAVEILSTFKNAEKITQLSEENRGKMVEMLESYDGA